MLPLSVSYGRRKEGADVAAERRVVDVAAERCVQLFLGRGAARSSSSWEGASHLGAALLGKGPVISERLFLGRGQSSRSSSSWEGEREENHCGRRG